MLRRSLGATRSMPVVSRPRTMKRRRPTLIRPVAGIAREVHAGGDVGAAVLAVLQMHRQLGEVDVGAGHHHLLHRRLVAAHLDEFRLGAQPAQDFRQQLLRRGAERLGEARAARERIADQRMAAGVLEQHRLGIAFERGGDLGQLALRRCAARSRRGRALRRNGAAGSGRSRPASPPLLPTCSRPIVALDE